MTFQTQVLEISTHTLTWSVTYRIVNSYLGIDISTHTLTWSVTAYSFTAWKQLLYFNSHAHVERDGIDKDWLIKLYDFNSHAHVERDGHMETI